MDSFVFQNWTTVGGNAPGILSITQSATDWLDLSGYRDVMFWLQVSQVALAGATNVTVYYQTAPLKEESLLSSTWMSTATITAAQSAPIINKVLVASATNPISRWARWSLGLIGGTPSGPWNMTFRILASANRA